MSEPSSSRPDSIPTASLDLDHFDRVRCRLQADGMAEALSFLSATFRKQQLYPQLFEVLKMQCRLRLGLPPVETAATENLDADIRRELEDGLLAACLEVGLLIWKQGDLSKGWLYLQPVGSNAEIVKAFKDFPVTDENQDEVIDISIGQGLVPPYGYQLLIERYGTCNAITTFDMQAGRFERQTQQAMARILLHHVYRELVYNLLSSVFSQPDDTQNFRRADRASIALSELLELHPELSAKFGHHIDATHLASVVRISKLLENRSDVKMALELTEYGADLHTDFHYPSPPPFEDTYRDHRYFYQAQLGIEVESAIQHFRHKCSTVDSAQYGGIAYETLAELLVRCERRSEAIEVLAQHVWGKYPSLGVAPKYFRIAQTPMEHAQLQAIFREQNDLLSYTISLLAEVGP